MPDPEMLDETRYAVTMFLVDASTGILRALRYLTISPHCSRQLNVWIRDQASKPFNEAEHMTRIGRVYRMYPRSSDMAQVAKIKCRGGD